MLRWSVNPLPRTHSAGPNRSICPLCSGPSTRKKITRPTWPLPADKNSSLRRLCQSIFWTSIVWHCQLIDNIELLKKRVFFRKHFFVCRKRRFLMILAGSNLLPHPLLSCLTPWVHEGKYGCTYDLLFYLFGVPQQCDQVWLNFAKVSTF